MNLSVFSIRTILGFIIGMMGLLAFGLALLSGSVHRDLVFDSQRSMMHELLRIEVMERLGDLEEISQSLGIALQSTSAFKSALASNDDEVLLKLLNNQFHQYFVTADVIKLEQLVLLDKNISTIVESSEGSVHFSGQEQAICPDLYQRAGRRTGADRMSILHELCQYQGRPIQVAMVPVGGLILKGYLLVITDPTHVLADIDTSLAMPLRIMLPDNTIVYQSSAWPDDNNSPLFSDYEIKTSSGVPVVLIRTAQNTGVLTELLQQARVEVMMISGFVTLLIVVLSAFILRSTMIVPLNKLTGKLRVLHENRSNMGEKLEVTGTREIHEITDGFNDMSQELGKLYQSLERLAYTDTLTKLPNRNQFQKSLEMSIKHYQENGKPFVLFLIDLDRFKGVNDTLGHHVGDELLKAVSLRLQHTLRIEDIVTRVDEESVSKMGNDMVARLGGDEFSAILTDIDNEEDVIAVAEKLVKAMEQPFVVKEHLLTIGLSIGIVMYPEHGKDMHTLVSHADVAMYNAKSQSSRYSIYNSSLNRNTLLNLKLEQDLFSSIKNNELVLHYQSKVEVATGDVVGAEALLRWHHPEAGMIPPDDFIPIAEYTGFIQPITEWVLDKALEDFSKGSVTNGIPVSVNLSALNLRDERLPSIIGKALKKWSMPPELLVLELTESTIMSDPEFSVSILMKLDAMGISLSIDDFGTGHSSLAYVKQLPVDEIKIDKSFVKNITKDSNDAAVVHAVMVLANHLNLSVVAEGVEDAETLEMLRRLGCDVAQGYYFSKPVPLEQFQQWLKAV